MASAEYVALTEHERLLREISRIPGFEDVDASPDYDVLRAAASEGPIVYLAAAEEHGLALVVTPRPEPVLVELPAIDRAAVDRHVARLLAREGPEAIAREMDTLLPRMWSDVVGPLAPHLPPASLVTLIAGGALAELPIHMAGAQRDDDGGWHDRTGGIVFRYAPNARVLLRAQQTARALAGQDLSVLTAGVSDAPGRRRLRHALRESEGVAASFAPARAERPSPATVATVQRYLDDCAVWHFACHGIHDPMSPLDSRLELADGPLTLRTMFARQSGTRRLAVLSACQTAMVDGSLRDEVVGFPSAMLQAGVAGVVSCQAEVEDDAAMLLVLDFFARFRHADAPARALAEAQAWLRTATNREIHGVFPGVHAPPEDERPDLDRWYAHRPFADTSSWVLFSYTGA